MISKLIFLSILVLIFALFNIYFYRRILHFFTSSKQIKNIALSIVIFWELGFAALFFSASFWEIRPVFASVLGFLLFTFVFGATLEAAKVAPWFGRTKYLLLGIFVCLFGYSFYTASLPPTIKYINIKVDDRRLSGITLAVATDIHLDPSKKEFATSIVSQINNLNADMVLIVGDLFDGKMTDLEGAAAPLAELKSRYGVFFAPGNHEYYYGDFDAKMDYLRSIGINTLINQNANVMDISIVGVADLAAVRAAAEGPNPQKAFANTKKPTILLAHQPKTAKDALFYSPDIVFCGHTHNGQIWPFNYLVSLAQPFVYGEYRENTSQIIVTSGAGLWGPPMRLFSRSEILAVRFF